MCCENMVFRDKTNTSSGNVENDDDTDEDDDEGLEDVRNEPPMQTPPHKHQIIDV